MSFNVEHVRRDFPILERSFHGKQVVYLDSAATSQKPRPVVGCEEAFYLQHNANVHRGVYALSEEATDAYEGARERMGRFVGATDASEIVFVRGTTEGMNLLAGSLARSALKPGDHVLVTVMEHHSNIVPWQLLKESLGLQIDFLDIDESGRLNLDELDRKLTKTTRIVSFTHVSNVLGTVNPVREIADRAHAVGARVLLDAAQSAPHRPIDVDRLGVDALTFSGHKMLGPTGIGVLWGRREFLDSLPPWMGGGEMIREVHQGSVAFREPPARFEAGTPNVAGAVGLAAAADYLEGLGWDSLHAHERTLMDRAFRSATERFGEKLRFVGPPPSDEREAVLSFSLAGVHPHDVASLLDEDGIAIRSGHHCAQPLMERLGVPALSRASPYCYNTTEEIDRWMDGLERIDRLFSRPVSPAVASGS